MANKFTLYKGRTVTVNQRMINKKSKQRNQPINHSINKPNQSINLINIHPLYSHMSSARLKKTVSFYLDITMCTYLCTDLPFLLGAM